VFGGCAARVHASDDTFDKLNLYKTCIMAVSLMSKAASNHNWKGQETKIAIAERGSDEWQYLIYSTWHEARDAVNEAREQGKQAVFYDGATLPEPPTE